MGSLAATHQGWDCLAQFLLRWYELGMQVWEQDQAAPALLQAGSVPGQRLWHEIKAGKATDASTELVEETVEEKPTELARAACM